MNDKEQKKAAPGQKGHVLILALGIPLGGIAGAGIGILAGHMRSAPAQTAWAAAAVLIIGIGTGMLVGYRIGRWRHCKTCLYRELWNPERPFEALKAAMASWDEAESKKDEMDSVVRKLLLDAQIGIVKKLLRYIEDDSKTGFDASITYDTYQAEQVLWLVQALGNVREGKGDTAFCVKTQEEAEDENKY